VSALPGINQIRLVRIASDGPKRFRFPLALPNPSKSSTYNFGVHGLCTNSTMSCGKTAMLTLYRRHSEKCPVHRLKLTPAAKRKYMDCECPLWGLRQYRNDPRSPSEHRNQHHCSGGGPEAGTSQERPGPKGPWAALGRLHRALQRITQRGTGRKNRGGLSVPARPVARLLRDTRRSLHARTERRSPRRLQS